MSMKVSMKHEHILNPVTAVEFYQNGSDPLLILTGEGSFLKIFQAESSKLLQQCEVFHGQAIHGIAVNALSDDPNSLKVVIWGGPLMIALRDHEFQKFLETGMGSLADMATCGPDWIMDVALSPDSSNNFAIVTAHNTVLQARLDESNKIVLETPSSPSRSILYSAHLIWDSASTLLVAAGTVFGEVIVWRCDISGGSEVLHTFTGHEGSIFGVNISKSLQLEDGTVGRLLASCSDDRTIRVWRLTSEPLSTEPQADFSLVRETGFGDNQVGDSTMYEPLATVMGHASRIWGVKFLVETRSSADKISVLSFGEDSTTQLWALEFEIKDVKLADGPKAVSAKLVHSNTFAFHNGKHIWSSALQQSSQEFYTVITGGADGKISTYDIRTANERASTSEIKSYKSIEDTQSLSRPDFWDLEDILKSFPSQTLPVAIPEPEATPEVIDPKTGKPAKKPKTKKIPKDALNRYGFLSEDQVLMTTTFGRVFRGKIKDHVEWQEVSLPQESPEGLKSYALITGFPELNLAFFAGANGKIYICQEQDRLREVADLKFKVADMFKIFDTISGTYELLLTTLGGQVATLFSIDLSSPNAAILVKKSDLTLPDKFVVTSAGKVKSLLALGSRSGSIALYSQSDAPINIWLPPPGSALESITTVIPVASNDISPNLSHILTTSRDGKFSIFSCILTCPEDDQEVESAAITPLHQGNPPFGPMIESAWFSAVDQDLILYGFKSKNFIVWNNTKNYTISNIDCGGAHRSYAYSPRSSTGGGHFVYTKASKLYIHTQDSVSHKIVKEGGHGREIKACAVSEERGYIATGAEDTEIRLWNYYSPGDLTCKAIVQRHTAGIQYMQFHKDYLFSSGGNEEFYVWAISQIPGFGVGIICEASYPDQTPDCDLRIMSFDVSAFPGADDSVLISLAFSDSTIRSYAYSKDAGFKLIASGRYTSSCLMQIKHLKVDSGEVCLVTAATDGRLLLWKFSLSPLALEVVQMSRVSSLKVHQSSPKALDITFSANRQEIIVATGGDDNAIAVSVYNNANLANAPKSFILRSAHAAAITGISFIPTPTTDISPKDSNGRQETFIFASSSNDQRVKEWTVVLTATSERAEVEYDVNIKQTGDAFTAVADVGDLVVLPSRGNGKGEGSKVLVVGNGMEIWDASL